jgi:hypothetical protein
MKTKNQFSQSLIISLLRPILFVIMLLLCGLLSAQVDKSFFDVYYSNSQSWAGGAYGSGGGTNYSFSIKFNKDVRICLDTVWYGDAPYYLFCSKYVASVKEVKVQKGDSINYTSSIYYPGERDVMYKPDLGTEKKVITKNPCPDVKCAALIQFHVNGVKYFYPVNNIVELAPIAYP